MEAGNVKFKQKTVQENIVTGVGTSWTESDTLPGGWRLKEEGEGAQKKTVYLSPEGKVFWTRYQVLEAVIKSGGSQEDIAKVQRGTILTYFHIIMFDNFFHSRYKSS